MTIDDKVYHWRGNSDFLNWILNRASSSAIDLINNNKIYEFSYIQNADLLSCSSQIFIDLWCHFHIGSHQHHISVHFQFQAEQSLIFTFSCLFGPSSHFENTSCFGYNRTALYFRWKDVNPRNHMTEMSFYYEIYQNLSFAMTKTCITLIAQFNHLLFE